VLACHTQFRVAYVLRAGPVSCREQVTVQYLSSSPEFTSAVRGGFHSELVCGNSYLISQQISCEEMSKLGSLFGGGGGGG
jgi:hypothetical protein